MILQKGYVLCQLPKLKLFFDWLKKGNGITWIFNGMQTRLLLTDSVPSMTFYHTISIIISYYYNMCLLIRAVLYSKDVK